MRVERLDVGPAKSLEARVAVTHSDFSLGDLQEAITFCEQEGLEMRVEAEATTERVYCVLRFFEAPS